MTKWRVAPWSGGLTSWKEGDTLFISVAFSWKLPEAFKLAAWYRAQGHPVRAGGPGVWARPKFLASVARVGGEAEALIHHNPAATVASRGCPVGCHFCIVPRMEGKEFTMIPDFTPRPILMDNNLSALPVLYQRWIIQCYIDSGVPLLDAQEGFEPQTFDQDCFHRWQAINKGPWRFAFDTTSEAEGVHRVCEMLKDVPAYKKQVYVLIGNEPMQACYERITKTIEWGCEPHVQPMIALNALQKEPMVRHDWTAQKLRDLARWANRKLWRSVPLAEYKPRQNEPQPFAGMR